MVSQPEEDGTSMAGIDTEACWCLSPPDTAQNDPDALVRIEDEEPGAVPIPISLQLLQVEPAALLDEPEQIRCQIQPPQ
jgi:hypothetical protein